MAGLVFALLTALPTGPPPARAADDALPAAETHGDRGPLFNAPQFSVHFSTDGKTVLAARHIGRGEVKLDARLTTFFGHAATEAHLYNAVTNKRLGPSLSFNSKVDGAVLVALHDKTVVTVHSAASGKSEIQSWDAVTGKSGWGPVTVDGYQRVVAFSPEGKTIVTVDPELARLWDAATGKAIGDPLLDKYGWSPRVAFSPDGKTLVTGTGTSPFHRGGGKIRFWDVATGKPRGEPLPQDASEPYVYHLGFSPDGKTLLTMIGGQKITFRVWDVAKSKPLGEPLDGFRRGSKIPRYAYSPDARTVLTAFEEKTAQLWDVVTGKPLGKALPHGGMVHHAAFSPDGKVLLTASGDYDKPSEIRLWDVATGKPFCRVPHEGTVVGAAFSPDGTILWLASQQEVRLWQVPKLSK